MRSNQDEIDTEALKVVHETVRLDKVIIDLIK